MTVREFPTVETAMAATGGAGEGVARVVVTARHELTAAVVGVSSDGGGVVPHAFLVPDHYVTVVGGGDNGEIHEERRKMFRLGRQVTSSGG